MDSSLDTILQGEPHNITYENIKTIHNSGKQQIHPPAISLKETISDRKKKFLLGE